MTGASATTIYPVVRWPCALALLLWLGPTLVRAQANFDDDDVYDDAADSAGADEGDDLEDRLPEGDDEGLTPRDRDSLRETVDELEATAVERETALEPSPGRRATGGGGAAIPIPSAQVVPRQTRFFRDLSSVLPSERFTAIAVDPGDPEIFLAGSDGFVFKSDDGGESWRPTLSFPRGLASDLLIAGDGPQGAGGGAGGGGSDLLVQDRNVLPVDETDLQQQPDVIQAPQLFGGGTDLPAGDFDADIMAPTAAQSFGVRVLTFVSGSSGTVYVGTPRGAWRSVDAGESWSRLPLPTALAASDVRDISINPARPSRVWFATRAGLLLSTDGGATTSFVNTGGRVAAISVLARTVLSQPVVMVGTGRGLWRSWDDGATFRKLLLEGVSPNEPVGELAIDEGAAVFYAGTPSGLFVAERRMGIFEQRSLFQGFPVVAISPDPMRPRGVAVGVRRQGLFLSEDTGITIVQMRERFPAETARAIDRRGDDFDALVVATPRGIFVHQEGSGVQVSADRMRALQELWSREPTLAEVVKAALEHQQVGYKRMRTLEQRARLAALAPRLTILYRFTWGRPEEQEEFVLVGDEPADFDERNARDLLELYDLGLAERAPQVGINHWAWITAIWQLDQLIYNPWERAIPTHRALHQQLQRRVAGRVQEHYIARRRLVVAIVDRQGPTSPLLAAKQQIRLQELTALLDGATGGAFSRISADRGADLDVLNQP